MHRIVLEYFNPTDPDAFDARYRDEHVALVGAVPGLIDFILDTPGVIEVEGDTTDAVVVQLEAP